MTDKTEADQREATALAIEEATEAVKVAMGVSPWPALPLLRLFLRLYKAGAAMPPPISFSLLPAFG